MEQEHKSEAFEWCDSIIFGLAVAICILVFGVFISNVNQTSMFPTLKNGDRILLQSFLYTPHRGDIVTTDTYTAHKTPLVKRVIALGGDIVEIKDGKVIINGEILNEAYLDASVVTDVESGVEYPLTVPNGMAFLMGDNRGNSLDSRSSEVGLIDVRNIQGKVIWRLAPGFGKVE